MTFITSIKSVQSDNNSNSSLSSTAYNTRSDTLQSGTISTVTLDLSASSSDDTYNGQVIEIISGTGIDQSSLIADYVGSTKVATLDTDHNFSIAPDSSSIYVIHINSGQCQIQNGSGLENKNAKIKISSSASSSDNFYNQAYIRILSGDGKNQTAQIIDYDGTNKVISINIDLSIPVSSNSLYSIYGEGGLATSATSTTFVLEAAHGHSSTDDFYNNLILEIYEGTGIGQTKVITDYVGSTRTCIVSNWDITPDSSSKYIIYGGWTGTFENVLIYSQLTTNLSINMDESVIFEQQQSKTNTGSFKTCQTSIHTTLSPSPIHTLPITTLYYRLVLIGMGTTLTGNIQVILHSDQNGSSTISINEKINDQMDCKISRSILTGKLTNTKYKNVKISSEGNLLMDIINPVSSFGELVTSKNTPVSQISFLYGLENIIESVNSGTIVEMETQGDGSTQQVQRIFVPGSAQFTGSGSGDYFLIKAGGGGAFYVWFNVDSGNSDPAPGGTGISVAIGASDTPSTVASALQTSVDANINFSAVLTIGNQVTITNAANGDVTSIQPITMPLTTSSAVTHDSVNSLLEVTNGQGIGYFASLKSKRAMKYRPGQGALGRFTAIFDTGETGTCQLAGIGNQISGLFFGYNGSDFGIMHRSTGQQQIYKLQITFGASGSETAIITLDGIDFLIPITSGSVSHNAYEISIDTSFIQGNWLTESINDTIIFSSRTASGPRNTNTFSFSSSSATGTFTEVSAGINVIDTWIKQTEWNVNRMLGDVNLDMVLNPTKGNVYQINFQWLGFGGVVFKIEDEDSGQYISVHIIKYANKNIIPSLKLPDLRSLFTTFTTTATSLKTIKSASAAMFIEGDIIKFDNIFSTTANVTTSSANETYLTTLKNLNIFNGKINGTEIGFKFLGFANDGGKSGTIRFYLNSTLGETDFNFIDEGNSSMIKDTINTTIPTDGRLILTEQITGNGTLNIDLALPSLLLLHNNETFTITVQRNTNTNVELSFAITWQEDR